MKLSGRSISKIIVPDTPGVELGWWAEGAHLVVSIGVNALESHVAVANGDEANFTTSDAWKKYGPDKADFEMTSLIIFDIGAVRDTFSGMPIPVPPMGPDAAPLTVGRIAELFGLDTVGAAVSRSGYKGEAMWTESTLEAPGDKEGLLAFAEQEPITFAQLPPLPKDTAGFVAGSFSNMFT